MSTAALDPLLLLVRISWSVWCRILAIGAAVNYQGEEFVGNVDYGEMF